MIHDEDFRQRIIDMENEPVPYYAMLTPDLLPLPQEMDEEEKDTNEEGLELEGDAESAMEILEVNRLFYWVESTEDSLISRLFTVLKKDASG